MSDRDRAEGGGEGQVERDVLQHGRAEHLELAADDLHRDVVAERSEKVKTEPAATAGSSEGTTTRSEGRERACPEVGARLEVGLGEPLEGGIHRQNHVGQPEVGQGQPSAARP